jgi:hypothetical protein
LVDLDGDGSLEQSDGKDNSVTALKIDQNSFEAAETSICDAHAFSYFYIGPRLARHLRRHRHLHPLNFCIGDGKRRLSIPNDLHDAG